MSPSEESAALGRDLLLDPEVAGAEGAGELSDAERKRRRRKTATLAGILIVLALIIWMILRSLGGGSPLPGIPQELPHHLSDIYGSAAPIGVAVSPSGGRVYVTESEGRRLVRVFNDSGEEVDTLKPPGHNWGLPVYVAVSPKTGDVFVSDRLREDVEVYGPEGKFLHFLKPKGPLGKGANPLGLAFGPEDHLYMSDVSGSHKEQRVLVFSERKETPLRRIGKPGAVWFANGLAVDGKGDLYVADSNDGRLEIYNPRGNLASTIARGVGEGDLGLPRGIAISGDRLFVVDTTAHAVKVYRLPGNVDEVPKYVGSFGVEGIGNGQFQYPNGIAIGSDGRIYVTDRENDRVQIWSY